jgi:hypothetical protein
MPWDLAISDHGDLLFSGHRDLQFVDGAQLMNQRIINRMRIQRGSWIFNRNSSLGSDLDSVLGFSVEQQLDNVPHLIEEALVPIRDEIDIQSIFMDTDDLGSVTAILNYSLVIPDSPPDTSEQAVVQLLIPVTGVTA